MATNPPRMGRINFLNVLPIYHPLEAGIIPHDYELVAGAPALLNDMMNRGELQLSSCSCFEYARSPEKYYLVPDLSIGSNGPVMSVLLLSRLPVHELEGREILMSGESHTSAALVRLLMKERYKINVSYRTGPVSPAIRSNNPPVAFLAIGDEALRLRNHTEYPVRIDLGEAWRQWTGLPFIFGLWVISAKAIANKEVNGDPGELLRRGRDWGLSHLDIILDLTSHGCPLSREELAIYYQNGLVYSMGEEELAGLQLFFEKLAQAGRISQPPKLRFF